MDVRPEMLEKSLECAGLDCVRNWKTHDYLLSGDAGASTKTSPRGFTRVCRCDPCKMRAGAGWECCTEGLRYFHVHELEWHRRRSFLFYKTRGRASVKCGAFRKRCWRSSFSLLDPLRVTLHSTLSPSQSRFTLSSSTFTILELFTLSIFRTTRKFPILHFVSTSTRIFSLHSSRCSISWMLLASHAVVANIMALLLHPQHLLVFLCVLIPT